MLIISHGMLRHAKFLAAIAMIVLPTTIASRAATATESTIFTYSGDQPSPHIQVHDGKFYGTSPTGGINLHGYFFRLSPGGTGRPAVLSSSICPPAPAHSQPSTASQIPAEAPPEHLCKPPTANFTALPPRKSTT